MTVTRLSGAGMLRKSGLFLVFCAVGVMVFAILPLSAELPIDLLLRFHSGLTALLLLTAVLLRRSRIGAEFWRVAYVFFVAATSVLASTLFSGSLLDLLRFPPGGPQWTAIAKLSESLWRVVPILALMAMIGVNRRSLYLGGGKLALGLAIGIAGFGVFAGLAFIPLLDDESAISNLLSLAPWILIFVFANGFMEELLFRGLFLKRFEPFLGKGLSNLLTATVFTLAHVQVSYVSDVLQFLLMVFPLALTWGYLMQRTGSLWGSALFHAGADCMIVLGIFASP